MDGASGFSDAAREALERSEYKGNVRELEGIILSAYLWTRHQGAARIEVDHLPKKVRQTWNIIITGDPEPNRIAVARALQLARGNVTEAARLLQVSRTTIMTARRRLLDKCNAEISRLD